ncbi:Ala-tRNA(Pro) deacylase [Vulcaniibacterium tengchongense]|uniref:Ala-tRNA(Pro) deacylase n=2 Tax=Vulcaniibacterium tengchongense TaxID=1273429 RepID=A0A3N4VJ82_9GAMM|nr:Ala-tRNA(Pro) deacylase [Vulcaniibacterium tengchongense]
MRPIPNAGAPRRSTDAAGLPFLEAAMSMSRLEAFLDSHRVAYDTLTHPRAFTAEATAFSARIDRHEMAKTVMVRLDGRLAMAVLPADERLSLARLREVSGASEVGLASEAEFRDRFPECEVGAMPPFGNLYGMEVYAADSLADEDGQIAFNAGTHRELLLMEWSDFERLVHPYVASLSRH